MTTRNNSIFKTENGDSVVFPLGIAFKFGWVLEGEKSVEQAKAAVSKGNFLAIPMAILIYLVGTKYLEEIGGIIGLIVLLVLVLLVYGISIFKLSGASKMYNVHIHGEIIRQ